MKLVTGGLLVFLIMTLSLIGCAGGDDREADQLAFLSCTEIISGCSMKLYSLNVSNPEPAVLATIDQAEDAGLDWSTDGDEIVFVTDGFTRLSVIDVHSKERRDIPNLPEGIFNLDWSPDGSRIAFLNGESTDVYTIGLDGSALTKVTNFAQDEFFGSRFASWSSDGNKTALGAIDGLYIVDADGSNLSRITDGRESASHVKWAPTGNRIAFLSLEDPIGPQTGEVGLYTIDADGSDQVLISDDAAIWLPSWSPDGNRLAFTSRDTEDRLSVSIANADGSELTNLTEATDGIDYEPAWSPDGRRIAFISNRDMDGGFDLYVMDTDGTNVLRLTNDEETDRAPVWAPLR